MGLYPCSDSTRTRTPYSMAQLRTVMGDTIRRATGLHADHESRPHRRDRPPGHHHESHPATNR